MTTKRKTVKRLSAIGEAVVKQIGGSRTDAYDTLRDVARSGAAGGYAGFTYYRDTVAFYDKNEELLWNELEDWSTNSGDDITALFVAINSGTHISGLDSFKNALAWWALETAAWDLHTEEEIQ